MSAAPELVIDEHDLYPVHEEDSVPDVPEQENQTRYLRNALGAALPHCGVTGEVCIYWAPGQLNRCVASDVLVVEGPAPASPPRVHLKWLDSRALLVISGLTSLPEGVSPLMPSWRSGSHRSGSGRKRRDGWRTRSAGASWRWKKN